MDNQNLDNQRRSCSLDLVLLFFMSLISLPFFLLLVSDLLAYGPYLFNHIKDIIAIGVILGDDLCILEGAFRNERAFKKETNR